MIALLLILPDSELEVVKQGSNELSKTESWDQLAVNANNEFTFNIFNTLAKDGNDVLSPISILSALSILMNGANGETLKDLKQFLRYKNSLTEFSDETINTAFKALNNKYHNDVIHNKDLKLLDTFIDTIKVYYKGDIQSADFVNNGVIETERVNEWIRNKTNNKIQKIFDEIKPDTSLIILNAIYFKGNWSKKFRKQWTQELDFYNNGNNAIKMDTMFVEYYFNYYESIELNSQILELQYDGREIMDESGTEAATVTAITATRLSAIEYPNPITFRADHPFMYFIMDKTNGLILFCGQINNF
ncbi:unnamed protein product [Medioppia subpectinata]|uniref:Serpin domain-containing protein n=1 Tax=Medioppia subpectinata TaxID=1979941 RepID=A0A7R9Q123_9ACAR|nr:unnamed protein product [Medioppia subpectinata]CAG2107879.1 unnamed protein product [Medioppia subpectinata]